MSIISTNLENSHQAATHQARLTPFLDVAFVTDRGGREENQDCCGYVRAVDGTWVFCVADGLGGHSGGRVAAQAAVQGVLKLASQDGFSFEQLDILRVFTGVQKHIVDLKHERPELAAMRTTLVVLAVKDGLALWGHIGDVRLYHLRRNVIHFQTKDQSVPQMLVDTGEIEPHEVRGHPDRSRVLQALGKEGEKIRVVAAPSPVQLESGDVLHLCTDGFWEWIEEAHLEAANAQSSDPGRVLESLVATLTERAVAEEPEYDNYTAMSISIGEIERNIAFWHKTRFVSTAKPESRPRSSSSA
jgi:PPM family protein phosphatase